MSKKDAYRSTANKLVDTNNAKSARSIYSATPTADRSAAYNKAKNRTLVGKEKTKKQSFIKGTLSDAKVSGMGGFTTPSVVQNLYPHGIPTAENTKSIPTHDDSAKDASDYSTDSYGTTQNPSFDRLRRQYQNDMNSLYNTRVNYLAGVRDRAISDARTKFAGLANNAYTAYRQNMAKRRSMASNLGMTGGAVENLRVGDENNYSTSLSNVNSGRNTAYTNARNAYSDAENDARVFRDTAIANNQAELSQAEIAYNQSQKQFDAQLAAQNAQWETENMQKLNELKQAQEEADKLRQANYETAKAINKLQKQVDKLQNRNNRGKGRNRK